VSRVSVLWPNRGDLPWLVFATALFGGLDVLVYGLSPATTGWAGPHAALVLQLSVDVSLLFLARFPVPVACWALVVAAVMLASERLAPGLFTPVAPVAHVALPFATPAIATNLVRLPDRRLGFTLIGLLAVLGTRLWSPSWEITPLGLVNTVLPALAVLYLGARRELVATAARLAERRRLAEEMHDVVTHRLSLMVLHAGALGTSSTEPAVRAAADEIRRSGATALAELRDLVGVLRDAGEARADRQADHDAPDPATLVAEARAVGEEVTYTTTGDPERISPTVRRTAYRVVQESLTNARKHAAGAAVSVSLSYRPDGLTVRVTNDAARRPPDDALTGGGGVGLAGLTQRVELVGGTLRAGSRPGGGYQVDAILPAYVPTRGDAT
jgi:signal transduction histidine kinase